MKAFYIILMILSTASWGQVIAQDKINWQGTKNWKLYDIHARGVFSYTLDTLKLFTSYALDRDSMQYFLATVTAIPRDRTPLWMGEYVGSCELPDGTIAKLEISMYGGFFYLDKDKKYFEVASDVRTEWLTYMADCSSVLLALRPVIRNNK